MKLLRGIAVQRGKVPLYRIKRTALEQAVNDALVLEARIHGISKDGGPACATVPLILEWSTGRAE